MRHLSASDTHNAAAWTLLAMIMAAGGGARAADRQTEIDEALSELRQRGASFKPDRLRKTGLPGFRVLLDRLLIETAPPRKSVLSKTDAERLVEQLGADDYKTRDAASRKLTQWGRAFRELIDRAVASKDPEVSLRAKAILSAWESGSWDVEKAAVAEYGTGFLIYLEGMTDEACWVELARRICMVFQRGSPRGRKRMILAHCVERIAKSGKDKYCEPLIPLLKHREAGVAVWLTRTFGSKSGNRYFPLLLVEALRSDRELVVDTAISWTPNCWDRSRSKEVRRLLTRIFDGDSERLKFHACFPLMHGYHDQQAITYLLSQAAATDKDRALRAISWLGDSCNSGRAASPQLLARLAPLLNSQDSALRRAAAGALGTYSGEEVVRHLIARLADKEAIIVTEAARNLLAQRDKAMLRRHLADAQHNSPSEAVRRKAKELLAKLGEKK